MKIVAIDFAGTILEQEAIDRANEKRAAVINRAAPQKEEHSDAEKLYLNNREALSRLTGLVDKMSIQSTLQDGALMTKSGKEVLDEMSTNLFQIYMYQEAFEKKDAIFKKGMIDVLQKIRDRGYHLALFSGIRTDIISGMLKIAGVSVFDSINGQPPMLGLHNQELLNDIATLGEITYIIGDKLDDLDYPEGIKIFVDWGQGKEAEADHKVGSPEELLDMIEDLDDHEEIEDGTLPS